MRTPALVLIAAATLALPALAGPPWISIEIPPNPLDPATRDAFLVVHTYHHAQQFQQALVGTAEGLVQGKRQTVQLDFTPTTREGVFALRKQWPSEGVWVLVIAVRAHAGDDPATALVKLGPDGQVVSVQVPTENHSGIAWPRRITTQEVEALLRVRA